jgi:hypothetical protein
VGPQLDTPAQRKLPATKNYLPRRTPILLSKPDAYSPHQSSGNAISTNESSSKMSHNEPELLMLLSPGKAITARDRRTGQLWQGTIEVIAPEQGRLWIHAELGERKLIDTAIHDIDQPAQPLRQ